MVRPINSMRKLLKQHRKCLEPWLPSRQKRQALVLLFKLWPYFVFRFFNPLRLATFFEDYYCTIQELSVHRKQEALNKLLHKEPPPVPVCLVNIWFVICILAGRVVHAFITVVIDLTPWLRITMIDFIYFMNIPPMFRAFNVLFFAAAIWMFYILYIVSPNHSISFITYQIYLRKNLGKSLLFARTISLIQFLRNSFHQLHSQTKWNDQETVQDHCNFFSKQLHLIETVRIGVDILCWPLDSSSNERGFSRNSLFHSATNVHPWQSSSVHPELLCTGPCIFASTVSHDHGQRVRHLSNENNHQAVHFSATAHTGSQSQFHPFDRAQCTAGEQIEHHFQ